MAYPTVAQTPRVGLFKNLFGGINLSSILSGTSKTLNVVNQAIPLVKQAGPIMKNAKTMFKVMNEFKKVETPSTSSNIVKKDLNQPKIEKTINNSGPTFFL
jgi:hypothetical protein